MTTPAAASLLPPIKPCPFCGGVAETDNIDDRSLSWFVLCLSCNARSRLRRTEKEACEIWNTRACVDHALAGQADTARLDWLEAKGDPAQFCVSVSTEDPTMKWFDTDTTGCDYSPTLRAAIDAAMKAQS